MTSRSLLVKGRNARKRGSRSRYKPIIGGMAAHDDEGMPIVSGLGKNGKEFV
jgi:hypothetical protein